MISIKNHPSYKYAKDVVENKIVANKDIHIDCERFIEEIDQGEDCDFYFDIDELYKVSELLKLLNMSAGDMQGKPVYDTLVGFQWFFITQIFCWKLKSDHTIRRYKTATLLIGRKNSKTFLAALIFILLLLTEPPYSELYSVAPDKLLSSQIMRQIVAILGSSPLVNKHFKISQKQIYCSFNHNKFSPLALSRERMDGREPAAFLSDETGALPDNNAIKAMQSGQMNVHSPLGIIISTAYPTLNNPMTQEIAKAEDKLEGENYDPRYFSMLYYPDYPKKWIESEDEMLKANPLAQEIPKTKENVENLKQDAIDYPVERQNFLTKFMNIFVDGEAGEQFVSEDDLLKGELQESYDWYGSDVVVGIDFSQSNDNFGITMITFNETKQVFVAKSWGLYPKSKESKKTKVEKVPYADYEKKGWVIGTEDGRTVNYLEAEQFIFDLEDKYGVNITAIAYDKWQALSSIAKFKSKGFDCIEIDQVPKALYPPTKFLRERIENGKFYFEKNDYYVTNYMNAKMITNLNLSYYLNKYKSKGKIDMVAATVNAMAIWQNREVENVAMESYGIHEI